MDVRSAQAALCGAERCSPPCFPPNRPHAILIAAIWTKRRKQEEVLVGGIAWFAQRPREEPANNHGGSSLIVMDRVEPDQGVARVALRMQVAVIWGQKKVVLKTRTGQRL